VRIRLPIVFLSLLLALSAGACLEVQPAQPGAGQDLPPRPEVVSFKAQPSRIERGSTVTLQWDVRGADSIVIDNGIGTVSSRGSMQVRPESMNSYNLTATSAGGETVSTVMVNVLPFIKVASPAATYTDESKEILIGRLPALGSNESYVFFNGAVMVGADNSLIVLRNNPSARNPDWAELKEFLKKDQTDAHAYVPNKYTCGDFAQALHNNAEAAGIRAALVAIELQPPGPVQGVMNHSLNAFETTDKGTVYIDDTSSSQGYYADKIVNVAIASDYTAQSIFPQPGQMIVWPSMGKVESIDIFQW